MSKAKDAREQATEYDSEFADVTMTFDDGSTITIPPHPTFRLLDDEALDELDAYQEQIQTEYDRDPDIYMSERTITDRDGNEVVIPAEMIRGSVKCINGVYFKGGKRVSPPHEIRVVQIALGADAYELMRSKTVNGKRAGARDVWRAWNDQGRAIAKRASVDSKSDGGADGMA